ncbi:hypothetical protein AVEN_218897-1 [Araneus ventricosus]|uniref:Uncharacterized protein n=1 Tax=Araneus ventricosus TaxID=182803 RepID=A0A4Y2S0T7_ARAVE|nr:hypothetical protein AVEN_218897-1 [Araneus ventricosus]
MVIHEEASPYGVHETWNFRVRATRLEEVRGPAGGGEMRSVDVTGILGQSIGNAFTVTALLVAYASRNIGGILFLNRLDKEFVKYYG